MRKNSSIDKAFAKAFGQQLDDAFRRVAKNKATKSLSVEEFATSLGLTRAGLHKARKGKSVPSLELIEKARTHGVAVKYGDLELPLVRKRAQEKVLPEAQLYLPFAVDNLRKENVSVELGRHKGENVELRIRIKFAG